MNMREMVENLRDKYPEGTRVKLEKMDDAQAPPIGTLGTVEGVDDIGSIMVSWDNGSGLNVAFGEDKVSIVGEDISFPFPTQVIFFDPELSEEHAGIAYNEEVICLECGGIFEIPEIEIMKELSWIDLEEECIGN